MSVTVNSTPFKLGWAKNRNVYKMTCDTLVQHGTYAHFIILRTSTAFTDGYHVVVVLDGAKYVFTKVASASDNVYEFTTIYALFPKMRQCFYLKEVFDMPIAEQDPSGDTILDMQAQKVGHHELEIYCTDADGERTGYETTLFNILLNTQGSDKKYYPNYAIEARLRVQFNNYNSVTTRQIDGLVFQPDPSGKVEIALDLLADMIPQPDLPPTVNRSSTIEVLTNALMKYRLSYGEIWGEDTPLIQNWTDGTENMVLCGEVAERFSRLNLSDWDDTDKQFSESNNILRILGEPSGKRSKVCVGQAEYVYAMWYDSTQALSATKTFYLRVYFNGAAQPSVYTLTAKNGEIYRIPVGPTALDDLFEFANPTLVNQRYYHVRLGNVSYMWEHTYMVMPDYYEPTEFVIQNKYGFLQTLVVPQVRREIVTEAEEMTAERLRYLNITENSEVYTATTALMTREEARRLAMCLGQKYHYVKNGAAWLRITIEAGSFTVMDAEENMVRVEFQYRFTENQVENIACGSLERSAANTEVSFDDSVVSFTQRTDAIINELL